MKVGDIVTLQPDPNPDAVGIIVEIRQVPEICSVMWYDGEIQNYLGLNELKVVNESR
jgi:hypothetical protein